MFKKDCIFCEIADKKAKSKILYESEDFIGFENINPQAPVHIILIPKNHIEKTEALSTEEGLDVWRSLMFEAYEVIKKFKLDETGYRIVNNGAGYHGIDHEHIHIIGGNGWSPSDNL